MDRNELVRRFNEWTPWMLRGGPDLDYPCADPTMKECAMHECQRQARCRKALDSKD
jgi:hypothetical protein